MKRFKKSLVALLVLVFVLSIMSTGFAASFSDVTDENTADAVARLTALNIINGYPDGTFKPGNTITRAEFAKVVVNALGLGNAAQYAKGMTKFKDVASTHWASGYIQVASDLGVIKGYPDGTFKPEANVTYAEAITMIMRALGYEPKATALGGYPGGYLAVAAEKGVTDNVNVVSNLGATRGDVAKMINNALEVPLMEQTSFGANPTWAENENKSLLKTKLSVTVIEGTVKSFDTDYKTVVITDANNNDKEYTYADTVSFSGLKNAKVTAWKYNGKIIFVSLDSTVVYDIVSDAVYSGGKITEITLKNADKTYKVDTNATITGDKNDLISDVSVIESGDTDYDVDGVYYGRFVITDGKITNATLYNITNNKALMVTALDVAKKLITYREGNNTDRIIRVGNYDSYKVIKNNKEVSLDSLKVKDIFYMYVSGRDLFIFASDKTVGGKLAKIATKITIDSTAYSKISSPYVSKDNGKNYNATLVDLLGKNITAYFDINNKVAYVVGQAEATTEEKAILMRAWTADKDYVKLMLLDGTTKTYTVDDGFNYVMNSTYFDKAFVKFTINEDGNVEFESDAVVQTDIFRTSSLAIDKTAEKIGTYYITTDTKIIDISKYNSDKVISQLSWDKVKNAGSINAIVADKDDTVMKAKVIFVNDTAVVATEDVYVGIVLDKAQITSTKYEITLDKGQGEETIVFKQAYNKGDIVSFKLDKDGIGVPVTVSGASIVTRYVYDIEGSFIKLAQIASDGTITPESSYYKVASNVVVYDFTDSSDPKIGYLSDLADIEIASSGKASQADKVTVYIDNGTIKAIKIEALGKTGNW